MVFIMKKRSPPYLETVDTGISPYNEEMVEDVEFQPGYKVIIDEAVGIHNFNTKKQDIFNRHRENKRPKKGPLEFMLPVGVNPHEPVKHLVKACVDSPKGYGFGMVTSVDAAKASRFERATDVAIGKLQKLKDAGLLRFVLMVVRYEDSPNPTVEQLRKNMVEFGQVEEPVATPEENPRTPRIQRLNQEINRLTVPNMSLITVESFETPPVFEDEPKDFDIDPGTRLY
jgi:hypothetical protein